MNGPGFTEWATTLADRGVTVTLAEDGKDVDLAVGDQHVQLWLRRMYRTLRPAEIEEASGRWRDALLVLPHVSRPVAAQLRLLRVSYATEDGAAHLFLSDGTEVTTEDPSAAGGVGVPLLQAGARPWAVGKSRVVHALLVSRDGPAPSQTQLAARADVTQAHVSGVLHDLADQGLVALTRGRPHEVDRRSLARQWLIRRRFAPVTTWWAYPGDLATAWERVKKALAGPIMISGDVAVDAIAPWRKPRQLILYTRTGSLDSAGMVAVQDLDEADVVLNLTDDRVVLASQARTSWRGRQMLAADDMQIWWDLKRAVGPDADKAVRAWDRHVSASWL